MRIRILISGPAYHFHADPDPDFYFKRIWRSDFLFDADPGYQNDGDLDADPDPQHLTILKGFFNPIGSIAQFASVNTSTMTLYVFKSDCLLPEILVLEEASAG
jgi:hypothetical protein